ncbi:hypothetical protein [Peribacillus butanolivorans]|uniref:hypothetical protein n=1 Tax=Peribacillus butanolivorans TaxID=421767 RepID=UPI00128F2B84|nr:hypothetical protein [Peribacillus butanolivorans]
MLTPQAEASDPKVKISIEPGFDRYIKRSMAMPMKVQIENKGEAGQGQQGGQEDNKASDRANNQDEAVMAVEGKEEDGKEKNITLSKVSIGSGEDLAEFGTGRFYDVTDASLIPSILSRETVMASRPYIEDNPFYPSIQNTPEWNGLFNDGVPKINANIATTTKQCAFLPLVSEKDDPVLVLWQYGMGTTVAFTSDLSGKWSGDWPAWGKWGSFLNQIGHNHAT